MDQYAVSGDKLDVGTPRVVLVDTSAFVAQAAFLVGCLEALG